MIERFALLIGAMKSGTTALFQTLRQHPEIAPSLQKETNFFCVARPRDLRVERYAEQWAFDPARQRVALEASTNYAKLPCFTNPAVFAHRLAPADFRFLYLVRDPVARIRSQYVHSLAEGWIRRSIEQGVAEQALLISSYDFQALPYLSSFGEDRLLVLRYEDYVRDRGAALRRICGFLDVDPDFRFRDPGIQNGSDRYRNRLLARAIDQSGLLPEPLEGRAHGSDAAGFREHCRALLAGVSAEERLPEIEAGVRRSYEPSASQDAEIRERLAEDLTRFCRRFGLPDWDGRECATSRPHDFFPGRRPADMRSAVSSGTPKGV